MELIELIEIDRLSFNKAGTILMEARRLRANFDYDLAVRRSQEALELFLKSLFLFLGVEYTASHDLKKQIYTLTKVFKQYRIDLRLAALLVLGNSTLTVWRSPAFYGDETLKIGSIFSDAEAALAISYAEKGELVCSLVREHLYAEAATRNQ